MKPETRLTRIGRPHDGRGLVNPAVERGSTVLAESAATLYDAPPGKPHYGRMGLSAQSALREALCELYGADWCMLTPSGLSAMTLPLLACTSTGGRVLAADCVYGPTRKFITEILPRYGVTADFFDPDIGAGIADLIDENTQAIFVESPGSLSFELQDIPAISKAAASVGAVVIADDTWSAGLLMNPLDLGAGIAAQALTKYVGGHSDILLGAALARGETAEKLKDYERTIGCHVSPDDAWLALRGLRTLGVRLTRSGESALKIADWLADRPEVSSVIHPARPDHPDHAIFKRDFSGSSGIFAVTLTGFDRARTEAFLDAMKLFGLGFSWGGFESLAIHCDPQIRRNHGKPEGTLIRFAIGLEDPGDLIADIGAAFAAVSR